MLSKKYRFHSRGGVRFTYKHGKTIRGALISLVYNDNSKGFTRFAVVVSKKVEKTAVGRNRIRRRMYEAIRLVMKDNNKYAKHDYIFVVYKKDILTMDFEELKNTVISLLEQSMI
ncbi:ribonuclease P protein component [Candidatus Saccharibacteria bacterium]|nr:ribonuclease P protein component [Candidatus Saccharibacteria bacterium]